MHTCVVFPKKLHTHDGEYEYDYTQHERQVTQCTDGSTHNGY